MTREKNSHMLFKKFKFLIFTFNFEFELARVHTLVLPSYFQQLILSGSYSLTIEEGLNYSRRQGKGRHVGLGYRILAALAVLPRSL